MEDDADSRELPPLGFSSLPLDLIYIILRNIHDRRTLISVILSSRAWFDAFNQHKDTIVRTISLREIKPFWKDAVAVAAGLQTLTQGLNTGEVEITPTVVMKFVREYNHWYGNDADIPSWGKANKGLEDEMIKNHTAICTVVKWYCRHELRRRQGLLRTKAENMMKYFDPGAEEAVKDAEVYIPETEAEVERVARACYRDWLFHIFFRDHSCWELDVDPNERWSYNGQPLDADMQVQFVCYTFWEYEAMYAVHRIIFVMLDGLGDEDEIRENYSADVKEIPNGDADNADDEGPFDVTLDNFLKHFIIVVLGYRGLRDIIRICGAAIASKPRLYAREPRRIFTTPEVAAYVNTALQSSRYRTPVADCLYQVMEWYPRFNRNRPRPATDETRRFSTSHVVPYKPYVHPLSRVADPMRVIKPDANRRFLGICKYSSRERYAKTRRVMYDDMDWTSRGPGGYEDFDWPENEDIDRGACLFDDWRLKRWGYLTPEQETEPPMLPENWLAPGQYESDMSEDEATENEYIKASAKDNQS